MQPVEPLSNTYPSSEPAILADLPSDIDGLTVHRPQVAPKIAVTALAAPHLSSPRERRPPGVYNLAGELVLRYLHPSQVAALRAADNRIEYIGPDRLQLPLDAASRRRLTIHEVAYDVDNVYRRFVLLALAKAVQQHMLAQSTHDVMLVPAIAARKPIDIPVGQFGPYSLRRRVPSIAKLLATDQVAAQSAGVTTRLTTTWFERRPLELHPLPGETMQALEDQMRQARQDIAAYSSKHLNRLLSALLIYGTRHDAPDRAYILPQIP